MADIAEQICLAVDQIVLERLKNIKYDTTIVATIVDNKYAADYKYTCSNGSAQFIAFSKDTTYKINDSVQVTIPNGDYDQQKIITGKYVADEETPYVFTQPFDTIVDVSANLITETNKNSWSLRANDEYDNPSYWPENVPYPYQDEVAIWSQVFNEGYCGFERLGIQGQFRSWISSLNPVSGNYGYRLEIISNRDEIASNASIPELAKIYSAILNSENYDATIVLNKIVDDWYNKVVSDFNLEITETEKTFKAAFIKSFNEADEITRKDMIYALLYSNARITELYLDSIDMYGNPYNFQSFYEQEKVYDITSLSTLYGMSLFFYEKSGSFYNENKEIIPYKNMIGKKFTPNLHTKDPYICLGYDLSNFDSEQAILYTMDGNTYLIKDGLPAEESRKTIRLRWLHEYENGNIVPVTEASELEGYEIRWYRYKLGAPSADEYSGVYWQRVESDQISQFSYTFIPDLNSPSEQIKAIVLFKDKVIRSNIISFTNETEVVNSATAALLAGLSIWCDDSDLSGLASENNIAISAKTVKNGIYHIYGQNNNLLDESKANIVLTMEARFADVQVLSDTYDVDAEAPLLTEATEIIWEFPFKNTMIVINGFNYNFEYDKINETTNNKIDYSKIEANDPTGERYKLPGYFNDASIRIKNNIVQITRKCASDTDFTINPYQDYRVGKTYSSTYLQNTVKCTIKKDSLVYSATKELVFGIMGTNGTDATVVIDFNNNRTALTADAAEESLKITARLYDSTHNEWDFNNTDLNIQCKWEWAYYFEGHRDTDSSEFVDQITSLLDNYKNNYKDATALDILKYTNSIAKIQLITQEIDSTISSPNICHLNHTEPLQITWSDTKGQDVFFLILKATITGYGDYELISYKAIPIRKDKTFRNYIGPTEVIYSTSGYANYYKQPLQLWHCDSNNVNEFDVVQDYTLVDIYDSNWDIYNPYKEESIYIGAINEKNILTPVTMYIKSSDPYGIVCYANAVDQKDPVWYQPLVILQNEYPSATVNRWDGKSIQLGTEADPNTILTPSLAAGSKDANGKFSGVMMGDWKGTDSEFGLTEQTGIYGFYKGAMSYAFKEDGTGFIGRSGKGRIIFKGDSGVIKSQLWDVMQAGMFLDLDDGILKLQKNSQYEETVVTENTYEKDTYYLFKSGYNAVPLNEEWSSSKDYYLYKLHDLGTLTKNEFTTKQANNSDNKFYEKVINYTEVTSYDESKTEYYIDGYSRVIITKEQYEATVVSGASTKYYILEEEYTLSNQAYNADIIYYIRYQNTPITKEQYDSSLVNGTSNKYYILSEGNYIFSTGDFSETQTYYIEQYSKVSVSEEAYNASLVNGVSTVYYVLTRSAYNLSNKSYSVNTYYYVKNKTLKVFISADEFNAYRTNGGKIYQISNTFYRLVTSSTIYSEIQIYAEYTYAQCYYDITGPEEGELWNTSKDPNLIDGVKYTTNFLGSYYYFAEGFYLDSRDSFTPGETYYILNLQQEQRFITLSASENTYPLSIGTTNAVSQRKFRVEWDGTVWIENGHIQGIITADELYCDYGYIGGWEIDDTALTGGKTILHSSDGIYTNSIGIINQISEDNETGLLGEIGLIYGSTGQETTYNIGMVSKNQSIVLDTMEAGSIGNIAFRSKGSTWAQCNNFYIMGSNGEGWQSNTNSVEIYSDAFKINTPAEKQEGIYARFA